MDPQRWNAASSGTPSRSSVAGSIRPVPSRPVSPGVGPAVGDVGAGVRQPREQGADLGGERVLAAVARAVDPPHLALGALRGERVEHRQHRRRADARAEQHDGPDRVAVEREAARGAPTSSEVALAQRGVQDAAHARRRA